MNNLANNYMKFIIICRQRSGSGLLRTYLKSHPELTCIQMEFPLISIEELEKFLDPEKKDKVHKNLKHSTYKNKAYVNNKVVLETKSKLIYNETTFPKLLYCF